MLGRSIVNAPDPFIMTELSGNLGYLDTSAKTLSSQSLNGGIRNCILLILGQSLVANNVTTAYTITNTGKVDNLNPYNGAIYVQSDPSLGCSAPSTFGSGCFQGRLADKLINANLFDRVISANVSVNASSSADWVNLYTNRMTTALSRLTARGMTPTAILWAQGVTDAANSVAQATYQSNVGSLITTSRSAGYSGPWFIELETYNLGSTNSTIRAAQTALVNHGSSIWQGPDSDTIGSGSRQAGSNHFTDTGSDTYAGLWLTALEAFGSPF